ncbi:YebC/PmpR family DNA-binding regulatory protein [Thermonema lapsum]|uniref:Probable transcriptional regulatory protein FHS56_001799 n=1 Tax=Thermonema lapsum TaxID=28195 RepID=A0A846MRS2_9BACT|nr:YebC/PmpR family DNA-binding transcriptional regulator [Thermonema lapsum]NIK74286.1 YebC/PmpR family DNA-binding regulatory protein [Thermonema lapsum]
MAGHSKWANIKHRKGAQDAKRGKLFTKLIREIMIAARLGGGDPASNPRLRIAIQNAKGANMPKDKIEKAIAKATGAGGEDYTEVTYEGYVNGVALYIECTTDNTNRTVANVRAVLSKGGGNLTTNGSLDFIFDRKGVFTISLEDYKLDEEAFTLEMADAGADEVEFDHENGFVTVYCPMEEFGSIQKKLEEMNIEAKEAGLQRIPKTYVKLDNETFQKTMKVIEALEDDDDVQKVYHNIEITDEQMEMA